MTKNIVPTAASSETSSGIADIAGAVRELTTAGWPPGYVYGATRYADVILKESFPSRFQDLVRALLEFRPTLTELRSGGGGRTVFVKRFDDSLSAMKESETEIWGKQNVTIQKSLHFEGKGLHTTTTRGHEIDMFGKGSVAQPIPGIAIEMEWNNKDPFFDRDLINFQALHREGAIAVGVIVTRGPKLQSLIGPTVRSKDNKLKFGQSSTHWDKLLPKVNLGGGGECPLLLVGIEPERIDGIALAMRVKQALAEAEEFKKKGWHDSFKSWPEAKPRYTALRKRAVDLMPPLTEEGE